MELKEFIKTTVTEITEAIYELQNEMENGTIINPTLLPQVDSKNCVLEHKDIKKIENLCFDVAVTVSTSEGIDGNLKAGIKIVDANLSNSSKLKKENISRLTFSIPVVFPSSKVDTGYEVNLDCYRN